MAKNQKDMSKEARISREERLLKRRYKEMPKDAQAMYSGLIRRAAYMRVTLEDYEAYLDENGSVEMFSQSEKLEPYERERPVARLYNSMNKNYQSIMKLLNDALPEPMAADKADEIMRFAAGAKK